jgi:hypothetical protein
VRSKTSLGSSREVVQRCGVSFVNYLYLVPLIIGQSFCTTCARPNQTGPSSRRPCGGVQGSRGMRTPRAPCSHAARTSAQDLGGERQEGEEAVAASGSSVNVEVWVYGM